MTKSERVQKETYCSQPYIYFDAGVSAYLPFPGADRVKKYLDEISDRETHCQNQKKKTVEDIETIREKLATFIGATTTEIAFVNNEADAICKIAQGVDWETGDEVIVSDAEPLSNKSIWYLLERRTGIKIICASANDQGVTEPEAIEKLITPNTRLMTFSALSRVSGAIQPVRELSEMAAKYNVMTLVNATYTAGILNHNVRDLGCDFYVASGFRGLQPFEGSGFLYVKKDRITAIAPSIVGSWNSYIENDRLLLPNTAKRFEAGRLDVLAIYSLSAALECAKEQGIVNIEQRVRYLTQYAIEKLRTIQGFELYGAQDNSQRAGTIAFNIQGVNPYNLVGMLEEKGVIIEVDNVIELPVLKKNSINYMARIVVSYFNSEEDINKLTGLIKGFSHTNRIL